MHTFVYTRILICARSFVRSLAPLYHPDTLVHSDTYIVHCLVLKNLYFVMMGVSVLVVSILVIRFGVIFRRNLKSEALQEMNKSVHHLLHFHIFFIICWSRFFIVIISHP